MTQADKMRLVNAADYIVKARDIINNLVNDLADKYAADLPEWVDELDGTAYDLDDVLDVLHEMVKNYKQL